jgi:hypothetical protein
MQLEPEDPNPPHEWCLNIQQYLREGEMFKTETAEDEDLYPVLPPF